MWRLASLAALSLAFVTQVHATEIIIDNGAAGASQTGLWKVARGKEAFGGTAVETKDTNASYTYTAQLPSSGQYEVYLWWTASGARNSAVPVSVVHANGIDEVTIDQQVSGGQWNRLGAWDFASEGTITLLSQGGRLSTSADAVKFVPVVTPAPAPVLGNAILGWDEPTTNSDGTPLTDLAGFVVYMSSVSGQYTTNDILGKVPASSSSGGASRTYEAGALEAGTYYFTVTAYNNAGTESDRSTEVVKTIGGP